MQEFKNGDEVLCEDVVRTFVGNDPLRQGSAILCCGTLGLISRPLCYISVKPATININGIEITKPAIFLRGCGAVRLEFRDAKDRDVFVAALGDKND